ncbi:MAG: 3,4-dihydroxy-2-butanone-4-phosphate synthase [Candidatus Njordarchaeota archaeon]
MSEYDSNIIFDATKDLKKGRPVLVFDSDSRERETDIFFLAETVDYKKVQVLRKDAGGLICVSMHPRIADVLGLPYLREMLSLYSSRLASLYTKPLPYDEKSAFSITINHVNTFTGITDRDRALTISRLGLLCREYWSNNIDDKKFYDAFLNEFRSPGHVFLLRPAKNIVLERKGHTELAIALAMLGKLTPCVVLAEMLGDDGYSLPIEQARLYAEENGYILLKGMWIIQEYRKIFGGKE